MIDHRLAKIVIDNLPRSWEYDEQEHVSKKSFFQSLSDMINGPSLMDLVKTGQIGLAIDRFSKSYGNAWHYHQDKAREFRENYDSFKGVDEIAQGIVDKKNNQLKDNFQESEARLEAQNQEGKELALYFISRGNFDLAQQVADCVIQESVYNDIVGTMITFQGLENRADYWMSMFNGNQEYVFDRLKEDIKIIDKGSLAEYAHVMVSAMVKSGHADNAISLIEMLPRFVDKDALSNLACLPELVESSIKSGSYNITARLLDVDNDFDIKPGLDFEHYRRIFTSGKRDISAELIDYSLRAAIEVAKGHQRDLLINYLVDADLRDLAENASEKFGRPLTGREYLVLYEKSKDKSMLDKALEAEPANQLLDELIVSAGGSGLAQTLLEELKPRFEAPDKTVPEKRAELMEFIGSSTLDPEKLIDAYNEKNSTVAHYIYHNLMASDESLSEIIDYAMEKGHFMLAKKIIMTPELDFEAICSADTERDIDFYITAWKKTQGLLKEYSFDRIFQQAKDNAEKVRALVNYCYAKCDINAVRFAELIDEEVSIDKLYEMWNKKPLAETAKVIFERESLDKIVQAVNNKGVFLLQVSQNRGNKPTESFEFGTIRNADDYGHYQEAAIRYLLHDDDLVETALADKEKVFGDLSLQIQSNDPAFLSVFLNNYGGIDIKRTGLDFSVLDFSSWDEHLRERARLSNDLITGKISQEEFDTQIKNLVKLESDDDRSFDGVPRYLISKDWKAVPVAVRLRNLPQLPEYIIDLNPVKEQYLDYFEKFVPAAGKYIIEPDPEAFAHVLESLTVPVNPFGEQMFRQINGQTMPYYELNMKGTAYSPIMQQFKYAVDMAPASKRFAWMFKTMLEIRVQGGNEALLESLVAQTEKEIYSPVYPELFVDISQYEPVESLPEGEYKTLLRESFLDTDTDGIPVEIKYVKQHVESGRIFELYKEINNGVHKDMFEVVDQRDHSLPVSEYPVGMLMNALQFGAPRKVTGMMPKQI